eukprot:SAG31_NODE_28169_length_414_cov_1.142857_1_plen_20_part_01
MRVLPDGVHPRQLDLVHGYC